MRTDTTKTYITEKILYDSDECEIATLTTDNFKSEQQFILNVNDDSGLEVDELTAIGKMIASAIKEYKKASE